MIKGTPVLSTNFKKGEGGEVKGCFEPPPSFKTKGVSKVVMATGNKERRCCCQVVQTRCNWMAKASGNKDVAPFSFFVNKAKNCDVKQITTFHPVYENRSDDVSSPNLDQECLKIGSLNPSKPLIKIFFQDVRPVKLVDLSLPEVKTGDVSVHCSRAGNCQQRRNRQQQNF